MLRLEAALREFLFLLLLLSVSGEIQDDAGQQKAETRQTLSSSRQRLPGGDEDDHFDTCQRHSALGELRSQLEVRTHAFCMQTDNAASLFADMRCCIECL